MVTVYILSKSRSDVPANCWILTALQELVCISTHLDNTCYFSICVLHYYQVPVGHHRYCAVLVLGGCQLVVPTGGYLNLARMTRVPVNYSSEISQWKIWRISWCNIYILVWFVTKHINDLDLELEEKSWQQRLLMKKNPVGTYNNGWTEMKCWIFALNVQWSINHETWKPWTKWAMKGNYVWKSCYGGKQSFNAVFGVCHLRF